MKTVELKYVKSTKGTHVYSDGEEGLFPALYLKKPDLPEKPPVRIKITLEWSV